MTTLRLGYGPLLLLLYQAAPIQVQQDSLGRYRVGVGFATGEWENDVFDCNGQLASATPVRHRSAGAQIDVWPDKRLRLSAFGGTTTESIGQTKSSDGTSYAYVDPIGGPFGGILLAYEGQKFGIGVGFTHLANYETSTTFANYLRIGNMDKAHFRMDVMTPSPVLPSGHWARIGIGINDGHLRKPGGFIGLGFGPFDYNSKSALTGELRYPIGRHFMGEFHTLVGPGEESMQWNVGAGLQFDFGGKH